MITSANTGYLKNTASELCTLTESGGFARTYDKYNNIPAIAVIIGRNSINDNKLIKGVYLISDIPEAVFYKPTDYYKCGYNTNTYTDEHGTVWYSSMWYYYLNYDSTITSGNIVNHSELVYSDEEFESGVPIKDILALAQPVVTPETSAIPASILLDAGERFGGDDSVYYWNITDGDLDTFADYNKEDASITYIYSHNLIPTSIDYCPRSSWSGRLADKPVKGLLPNGTWETITTFPSSMSEGQISTLSISTQNSYSAIKISADYLNIAYIKINGTYTNSYTKLKHYRLDITDARSWYADELCFSDIKTYANNTQCPIINYWSKYYTNNTYVPTDSTVVLAYGDSSIQSSITWDAYDVLSVFLDVVVNVSIETYTGSVPATINAAGEPFIDYLISGNMSQSSTPTPTTPITPQECGDRTGNLWGGDKIENCAFQTGVYATPTYNPRNIIYIPVIGGNTYTFSINNVASGTSFQSVCSIDKPALGVSYLINENTTFIVHGEVTTFTRTIPNEANWWAIQIMSLDNLSNNIMINEGSTPLPYEPYGYKLDVSSGGENLFDYTKTDGIIANKYIGQNRAITSDNNYYISYPIKVSVGETYTWRFNSDSNVTIHSAPTVGFYDSSDNLLSVARHDTNIRYFSFEVPINCAYIRCSVYQRNGAQSEAMLNLGSTAKPYSPYNRTTTPIYLGEVETTRQVKKLVFDGTENFTLAGTDTNRTVCQLQLRGCKGNYGFCTHIVWKTSYESSEYNRIVWSTTSGGTLFISLSNDYLEGQTADDFKAWLAAQYANGTPVCVWYVLATPTTGVVNEPLRKIGTYVDTISMNQAKVSIPTVEGTNIIDINTTLKPSSITLNYVSNNYNDDITSYILTTSNSDTSKDPVSWKLWTSNNGLYWNILDNISNANIPTARKTDTTPFTITSGTKETLTYVESDGSQYVDTKIIGNKLVDAEINIQVHDYCGNWGDILGSRDSYSSRALDVAYRQDTKRIDFQRGSQTTDISYPLSIDTPYKIEMLANKLYINNVEVISLSNDDFVTPLPMTFFARNQVYASRPIEYGRYRLYSAKIWRESNTLARDFVPARIKGVVGLYDNVTKSFFAPICGNPLMPPSVSNTSPLFLVDGNYMINLSNIIQSGKMKCELEVSLNNVTDTNVLLSNDDYLKVSNYGNEKFEASSINGTANYRYNDYYISPNTKYKLTLLTSSNKMSLIYDGNSSRTNGYSVSANSPMYLFGEGSGRNNRISGSVYSCKIWDDDTLVFDLASYINENGIYVYNAVDDTPVDAYGEPSGPVWVMIDNTLTNILTPEAVSMSEPLPMEFWTYEGTQLINILNPETIPTSTPPYPMMLWQEYDNVLYTNFSLENPLIGACANTNNVETLVIPESVKYIGTYAFRNTSVSEVTIASDCVYFPTSFPNGCVIHFHGEEESGD